jgi:hypothetical protein
MSFKNWQSVEARFILVEVAVWLHDVSRAEAGDK